MAGEILKIKTSVPPRDPGVLARSDLLEQLERGLFSGNMFARPLTLVSAPAGFGKTTVVREWIATRGTNCAWYALDEQDNDSERFWVYLATALGTVKEDIGSGFLKMFQADGAFPQAAADAAALLTPLLNNLFELEQPIVLVLDDYHHVNNPRIHEEMLFFIENMPPMVHVVVTSRSDPPWPLPRWRAKGQVGELRLEQLKFTLDEAGSLFSALENCELNEEQVGILHKKTEGWVTGLQLAALSLAANRDPEEFIRNFAGNTRHVLYFLSEEVFSQQSEDIKEFLLHTSVAQRFNSSLCDVITGRKDSAEILARLERENMFLIPLDEQGVWYRYHHLFADLLCHQLRREHPEKFNQLHGVAGKWFLKAGEPGEAIRHALAGGKQETVAQILESCHQELVRTEPPSLRIQCLNSLSAKVLQQFPRLLAHKAMFHLVQAERVEAEECLKSLEQIQSDDEELIGLMAAVKSNTHLYSQEIPQALEYAELALKSLPLDNHYWRMSVAVFAGDAYFFAGKPKDAQRFYQQAHRHNQAQGNHFLALSTGYKLAASMQAQGRLEKAEELVRNLLQRAKEEKISRVPRLGAVWTLLGDLMREQGNLEEAAHCIQRGLLISEMEKPSYGWNLLSSAALALALGDYDGVVSATDQIEILHRQAELPQFIIMPAAVWKARGLVERGELSGARDVLSQTGISERWPVQEGQEAGFLVFCRLQMKCRHHESAQQLLETVEQMATEGGNKAILLEAQLLRVALLAQIDPQQAPELLISTLQQGLESGYYQLFVDNGREAATVYEDIIRDNRLDDNLLDYTMKIYRGNSGESRHLAEGSSTQQLAENLTSREEDILKLISQGMTNQEISRQLYLSENTIKWYNSNIYGKLGVKNRTQAMARAQKLKMLTE